MWWAVSAFVLGLAVCRVMLASKSMDWFLASQKSECEDAAKHGQPDTPPGHGRVVPFRKRG